ncbi:AGE family epimerase/isomerase, partial [Mycobacterium tuberculosis]|nr:AGE family epimerase/isomerase [Mycobacterium tuberculosis]
TKAILDASRLLASDPELVSEATALVRSKGRSAARAVWETAVVHEKALAALGGRMAERIADLIIHRHASANRWHVAEHFTTEWLLDRDYAASPMFRPAG